MKSRLIALALGLTVASQVHAQEPARMFCAEGTFDLGWRLQGAVPDAAEPVPTRWCVTTGAADTVRLDLAGKSNSDVKGAFTTLYLPREGKVMVGPPEKPDVAFPGAEIAAEALRTARIDPRILLRQLGNAPANGQRTIPGQGHAPPVTVTVVDGQVVSAETTVDLPLRGRSAIVYRWSWPADASEPDRMTAEVDGRLIFDGQVTVTQAPADFDAWARLPDVHEVPGSAWPAQIGMIPEQIAPGVHRMRSVRTGFHHLVVETDAGLVIADAPAGWVELAQIPPMDMVPGLGVSGLSERFVDKLRETFPETPIRAVAITHHHDDHAGGARAFAAEGARIYAPAAVSPFLEAALSSDAMPPDRLNQRGLPIAVTGVAERARLEDAKHPVELVVIEGTPHARQMLGLWLPNESIFFQSDLHTANASEPAPPRSRALSECWFAAWARDNLPTGATILGSHTRRASTREQVVAWLDSEVCRAS